ncbi:RNA binding protein [Aspergillus eucalypticola CBS 122712]|uniref:RNA binding protein n=1 Tax=Aspergillus eucalypticola (strain CBS 122712 / IBT 29274) TaxID=1448314 RepID=A0A317WIX5_ASPEC|nr:RNA binding protein [Aspergillus eucalypticola CBS 122712]PWY85232.1 RNA binding protein [Aspergillus eucalypticola CBS 122712]
MPFPPREKGRMAKSGRSEEEFVLFLQGIPAHCRWQELKDLVRQTALHIRQAVVYDDQHGFPTGLGQIIVKNEDEAWRTYHRLSTNGWEGQSLVVTLARTSSPTRPIAGPTKSPTCMIPPNYVPGYSTPPRSTQNMAVPPSPISPEPIVSGSPNCPTYPTTEYGPMVHPLPMPQQPFMPFPTDPVTQQPITGIPPSPAPLRHSFGDAFAVPFLPTYSFTTTPPFPDTPAHGGGFSLPGRRAHMSGKASYGYNPAFAPQIYHTGGPGPRSSPRRTIFVQNLSPTTTDKLLRAFIEESGATVEQSEVSTDPDTGRCKGFARITLRTADEAKRVVAQYHGINFMDAKIRVKIDRSLHFAYSLTRERHAGTVPLANTNGSVAKNQGPYGPSNNSSPRSSSLSSSTSASSKSGEHCGPLVVNGSNTGTKAVAT